MVSVQDSPDLRACKMRGRAFIRALVAAAVLLGAVEGSSVSSAQEVDALFKGVILEKGEVILGLAGYDGAPLPGRWNILVGKPGTAGAFREVMFTEGKAGASRAVESRPGQDLPHLPIDAASLHVSATEAHTIAAARAAGSGIRWATVHYHLRVRDEGAEPVWLLTFVNRAQVKVGLVYLSARTGEVLRESWPQADPGKSTDAVPDPSKVSAR
jgi:hypothetical protein